MSWVFLLLLEIECEFYPASVCVMTMITLTSSGLRAGVPRSMAKVPSANAKSTSGKRSHSSKTVVINSEKSDSPAEDYQSTAPPTTPASQVTLFRIFSEINLLLSRGERESFVLIKPKYITNRQNQ